MGFEAAFFHSFYEFSFFLVCLDDFFEDVKQCFRSSCEDETGLAILSC